MVPPKVLLRDGDYYGVLNISIKFLCYCYFYCYDSAALAPSQTLESAVSFCSLALPLPFWGRSTRALIIADRQTDPIFVCAILKMYLYLYIYLYMRVYVCVCERVGERKEGRCLNRNCAVCWGLLLLLLLASDLFPLVSSGRLLPA
jgi:hypothetical protein